MFRRFKFIAVLLVVVPFSVWAADAENNYFQGVWNGEWSGFADPTIRQEATVEVGPQIRDGVYAVTYSWGEASYRGKNIFPGRIKSEGTVQGDTFHFAWENKMGRKFEMSLKKESEDTVKARLERSGPLGPMERPYSEALLKRK